MVTIPAEPAVAPVSSMRKLAVCPSSTCTPGVLLSASVVVSATATETVMGSLSAISTSAWPLLLSTLIAPMGVAARSRMTVSVSAASFCASSAAVMVRSTVVSPPAIVSSLPAAPLGSSKSPELTPLTRK